MADNAIALPQRLADFPENLASNPSLFSLVLPIGNRQLVVTECVGENHRQGEDLVVT